MKPDDTLEKLGYLTIPYPVPLKKAVREAIEAWEDFCALPEETKMRFSYTPDTAVGSGVGYELKKGDDGSDMKEDFHARANRRALLMSEAKKMGGVSMHFVSAALAINTELLPLVLEFARMTQDAYGMPGFEQDVKKAMPLWTIRFLHYFPTGDSSSLMASHHTDKGGFTPHLWESAPGLERLSFDPEPDDRAWTPMPFGHDDTVIFSGMRMQLRSKGHLKATCHRVAANEETAKKGRVSAVAFIDFLNTPYYDKDRFGRTQDFPPGFNYDIPHSKFRELFVEAVPA